MNIGTPRGPEEGEATIEEASNVLKTLFEKLARYGGDKSKDLVSKAVPIVSNVEDFLESWLLRIDFSLDYENMDSSLQPAPFERSLADAFHEFGVAVHTPSAMDVFSIYVSHAYFDEHKYPTDKPRPAALDAD